MEIFEFVIAIVAIVFGAGLVRHFITLQHERSGMGQDDAGRVADLEERVRVLEQIVTDQGYEVRKAFDDLEREGDGK
jgi:predicted ArsR family transcriptional regulator